MQFNFNKGINMVTRSQVNKAITKAGVKAELVKGDGYFYFIGEDIKNGVSDGVYVYTVGELSLREWMVELAERATVQPDTNLL